MSELTIREINRLLRNEMTDMAQGIGATLTYIVDFILFELYGGEKGLVDNVHDLQSFLTTEMQEDIRYIVESFETPEALVNFLIEGSEGQEAEVLDLLQILISEVMEKGI